MFTYSIYGLNILSDLLLPELKVCKSDGEPDAIIRLGEVSCLPSEAAPKQGCFFATQDEAYFFWEEDGVYSVRNGREIIVDRVPDAEDRLLRLVILGPAMGVLLHQRGLLTLHASATVIGDGAVAFLGAKGTGKSTTAAALHAHGYAVLADDILAVTIDDCGKPMVPPGFPQLKLWPDAAAFLGDKVETLPRLHPHLEKRGRPVASKFPETPLPLRRLYILDEGTRLRVEPLRPQEVFLELMRHSYAVRFLGHVGATAIYFRQCMRLANSIPILRIKRPRSLTALPALAKLVEEDLARDL